jgi:hypothetical protein
MVKKMALEETINLMETYIKECLLKTYDKVMEYINISQQNKDIKATGNKITKTAMVYLNILMVTNIKDNG